MKYFAIHHSIDKNIVGHVEQVKDYIYNCHIHNEPRYIGQFSYKKIDGIPILSNAVLHKKAIVTDLIQAGGMGFSLASILISQRFKELFDTHLCYGVQFFETYIKKESLVYENYWQTHFYKTPYEFIDFENTKIVLKQYDEEFKIVTTDLSVRNVDEFLVLIDKTKFPLSLSITSIEFLKIMNLDYFEIPFLEGSHGFISEKLKLKVENLDLTGIEFRPIDLPYQQWIKKGGRREIKYGTIPQMRPDGSIRK